MRRGSCGPAKCQTFSRLGRRRRDTSPQTRLQRKCLSNLNLSVLYYVRHVGERHSGWGEREPRGWRHRFRGVYTGEVRSRQPGRPGGAERLRSGMNTSEEVTLEKAASLINGSGVGGCGGLAGGLSGEPSGPQGRRSYVGRQVPSVSRTPVASDDIRVASALVQRLSFHNELCPGHPITDQQRAQWGCATVKVSCHRLMGPRS